MWRLTVLRREKGWRQRGQREWSRERKQAVSQPSSKKEGWAFPSCPSLWEELRGCLMESLSLRVWGAPGTGVDPISEALVIMGKATTELVRTVMHKGTPFRKPDVRPPLYSPPYGFYPGVCLSFPRVISNPARRTVSSGECIPLYSHCVPRAWGN